MDEQQQLPEWFAIQSEERWTKDLRVRVDALATWLRRQDQPWYALDLQAFGVHLQEEAGHAPATVYAYLSSVRAWLRELLEEGVVLDSVRNDLRGRVPPDRLDEEANAIVTAIKDAIDPGKTPVELPDAEPDYTRLTANDLVAFFDSIKRRTGLTLLRDRAIFGLMLGCGLRIHEIVQLSAVDLFCWDPRNYEPAVHVPPGFGSTERIVPYHPFPTIHDWARDWVRVAEIVDGPAFRGFIPRQHAIRPEALSARAVEKILGGYKIERGEGMVKIKPMDLRRAYARILYEGGISLPEIQARLGLKGAGAVLNYIGGDEADLRVPFGQDVFEFFNLHVFN